MGRVGMRAHDDAPAWDAPVEFDERAIKLAAAAIDECASNTVKHANGDQLTVEIRRTEAGITYLLRSNGDAPKEAVRESGGLLSLRQLVEKEGGTMRTEGSPSFTLTNLLPGGTQ